jgi:hypothetical protein
MLLSAAMLEVIGLNPSFLIGVTEPDQTPAMQRTIFMARFNSGSGL